MHYQLTSCTLNKERNQLLRSGSMYEVILFHQGTCLVKNHQQEDHCSNTQLIVMKPQETITLQNQSDRTPCTYMRLRISEESLQELSDATCDFPKLFEYVPYRTAVIHSEAQRCALLTNLLTRMENADAEDINLGEELYRRCLLTSFLIHLLRACVQSDHVHRQHLKKEFLIDDLFSYISRHLADDLSLETLEKHFYVSGEHISRKFHQSTGVTLHSYITNARIDLSRKYLLQGYHVKDIYTLCGFRSYYHFFSAFKKVTGMTPVEFYRSAGSEKPDEKPEIR